MIEIKDKIKEYAIKFPMYYDLVEYVMKLENNWNELKKWLEENKYAMSCKVLVAEEILNKMQELEQGKDE